LTDVVALEDVAVRRLGPDIHVQGRLGRGSRSR
jgi:hypothetical protein